VATAPKPASQDVDRTCGELDDYRVCVEEMRQRGSVTDGFNTTNAGNGAVFLMVRVSIASDKKSSTNLAWTMFELRDSSGEAWAPDNDAQASAMLGGLRTIELEQVHPGTTTSGWLVYYVPRSALSTLKMRFKPGVVRSIDLALPPGPACAASGKRGFCIDAAHCSGIKVSGLCEGPSTVQCCIQ
jgi:hypothetical protein